MSVDLDARSISFRPEVFVDLSGTVTGFGNAVVDLNDHTVPGEDAAARTAAERASQAAMKNAILQAVGYSQPNPELLTMIDLKILDTGRVSIKTHGLLRAQIWDRKIITFRTMLSQAGQTISGTALALSDPRDALPKTGRLN